MSIKLQIIKDDLFIYSDTPDETILREDMYQATFEQYVIDCGWYENAENGSFIAYLIKADDWDKPVIKILTKTFADAKWSVNECKAYLNKLGDVGGNVPYVACEK